MVRPNNKIQMFSMVRVGLPTCIKNSDRVLIIVAVNITGLRPSLSPSLTNSIEPKKKPISIRDPSKAKSDFEIHNRLYLVIQLSRVN